MRWMFKEHFTVIYIKKNPNYIVYLLEQTCFLIASSSIFRTTLSNLFYFLKHTCIHVPYSCSNHDFFRCFAIAQTSISYSPKTSLKCAKNIFKVRKKHLLSAPVKLINFICANYTV